MAFPVCQVRDLEGLLWTHVSLLSLSAILILASFNSQFKSPAPYGRHADPAKSRAWGFPIPQRVGHIVSDGFPGLVLCLLVFLLYAGLLPPGGAFEQVRPVNVVLLCGWLLHYLYRGILHPLIMPYSSPTVEIGITLAGLFPNSLFTYMIAAQLGCTQYPADWMTQPRFIIGVIMYFLGTAVNRWADLKMRAGRLAMKRSASRVGRHHLPATTNSNQQKAVDGSYAGRGDDDSAPASVRKTLLAPSEQGSGGGACGGGSISEATGVGTGDGEQDVDRSNSPTPSPDLTLSSSQSPHVKPQSGAVRSQYFIPRGGLFELVSCPNYTGELLEWAGYALAVWSWPALAWLLFCASTFIPRSLVNHRWYLEHFGSEYPVGRKALIPFIF